MYIRKTMDIYELHSDYGYGWECETEYDTCKEAKQGLREYRENTNGAHKLIKRRVKK